MNEAEVEAVLVQAAAEMERVVIDEATTVMRAMFREDHQPGADTWTPNDRILALWRGLVAADDGSLLLRFLADGEAAFRANFRSRFAPALRRAFGTLRPS